MIDAPTTTTAPVRGAPLAWLGAAAAAWVTALGLTLPRTAAFVAARAESYRVARDASGAVVGCVAVDEYAPSLAELVSLAVAPEAQGQGLGKRLIAEAERVARQRGYAELFAVSLADTLFLGMDFHQSSIANYPEKQARYAAISRSELSIGKKFLFVKRIAGDTPQKARGRRRATRGSGGAGVMPRE